MMQRRFREGSGILALFCEQESGIPGISAQNLPLWSLRPSLRVRVPLTVGMTKIPGIPG